MDRITKELDDLILQCDFEGRNTDVACYNKIKMDYYLMLTIAVTWDVKHSSMSEDKINTIISCLQRPETGKLIKILDVGLELNKEIVDIFNLYKEGRNLKFGHTTFDEYEANNFNSECEQCYNALLGIKPIDDSCSEIVRKLYQEENDFYYIASMKQNGEILVKQFGNINKMRPMTEPLMKSRMINKKNDVKEGDLFIVIDDDFVKVSPFVSYSEKEQLFLMLMDIEKSPLAFKMAYVYRTQYASESVKYLDEFPKELEAFFPKEIRKIGKNGITLNRFSQYELFEQDYFHSIHESVQKQLDDFIVGNMAYGAVRGVGGVGKTSAVFMWMNRVMDNKEGILDCIRERFNLRRIIFLSAKTKIYSRTLNTENSSNFYDIESDVSNYNEIVSCIYASFHPQEKEGISFSEKVEYIKNYSNPAHATLVIIDDYESLPQKSRENIQKLKDSLNPNMIKFLITTRFTSKESKDIIVEHLNEKECSNMTDYIFGDAKWKSEISSTEIHKLTGGLPLLIWYAKAYYQTGLLSSKKLKFSGPAEGLEKYLYDNFVQCFETEFTKNFLMMATRYYEIHNVLQISKKTAVYLSLKEPKEYKVEDEEFYFQELLDLKLITVNQSSNAIDFSPLMIYMDKSSKKQEPKYQYQKDNLKVLVYLDEEKYKDINAVIEALEYLENETKSRILYRIVGFAHFDEDIKILALNRLFALSAEKMDLYKNNIQAFQSNKELRKSMFRHLIECHEDLSDNYEEVRDFICSISVRYENEDVQERTVVEALSLIAKVLGMTLSAREMDAITNPELVKRASFLRDMAEKFKNKIQSTDEVKSVIENINGVIEDISTYCSIESIKM